MIAVSAGPATIDELAARVRAGAFWTESAPDALSCSVRCAAALEPRDHVGRPRWLNLAVAALLADPPDAPAAVDPASMSRAAELNEGRYALASYISDRSVHVVGDSVPRLPWGEVHEQEIAAGALALWRSRRT